MSLKTAIEAIIYAAPVAPQVAFVPSPEIQVWSSRAAFVLALIWILYAVMQFAIPSKRGGGGLGRGGAGKFIGVAVLIIILMDLKLLPTIINNILNVLWFLGDMIGIKSS